MNKTRAPQRQENGSKRVNAIAQGPKITTVDEIQAGLYSQDQETFTRSYKLHICSMLVLTSAFSIDELAKSVYPQKFRRIRIAAGPTSDSCSTMVNQITWSAGYLRDMGGC